MAFFGENHIHEISFFASLEFWEIEVGEFFGYSGFENFPDYPSILKGVRVEMGFELPLDVKVIFGCGFDKHFFMNFLKCQAFLRSQFGARHHMATRNV